MNEVSSHDPTASGSELHYPIFEKLVEIDGQEELIGLIAYGRYKRAKKIWASNFHARRKNSPSNDDLNKYAESWTDDRLQALLKAAEAALAEFGAFVTAQQEPTIREKAIAGEIRENLGVFVENTKMSWGKALQDIALSMLGALFYTILLILIVLVVRYSGVDFLQILDTASASGSATLAPRGMNTAGQH